MIPQQAHEIRALREAASRRERQRAEMAFWLRLEQRCRQAPGLGRLLARLAGRPQPAAVRCR